MAQLQCHCSTAHRLGAEPAPVPGLFADVGEYLRVVDEQGRLWLWRLDGDLLQETQAQHTRTAG
jgi:hypothetical protein